MFRLFLLLNFLLFNLEACEGGYDSCKQKLIDSNTIIDQTIQLPVANNQILIFSKKPLSSKNYKIIKHDPFLSLYLAEDKRGFEYPFLINMNQALGCASVDKTTSIEGKVIKKQIGLNSFALFSESVIAPTILTNSCCSLEGLITPEGIIQKEYLKRFMEAKDSSYADVGVRVEDKNSSVAVYAIDPFIRANPFKINDQIIELDGKKVKESSTFMMKILFSKVGTSHKLKVKRGSKILEFNVQSQQRYGGGYISDTFLEQKGSYFSKDLIIIEINDGLKKYGMKLGDKLLQVNGIKVENQKDVVVNISNYEDVISLLFLRDGFEFFVTIKEKSSTETSFNCLIRF